MKMCHVARLSVESSRLSPVALYVKRSIEGADNQTFIPAALVA